MMSQYFDINSRENRYSVLPVILESSECIVVNTYDDCEVSKIVQLLSINDNEDLSQNYFEVNFAKLPIEE